MSARANWWRRPALTVALALLWLSVGADDALHGAAGPVRVLGMVMAAAGAWLLGYGVVSVIAAIPPRPRGEPMRWWGWIIARCLRLECRLFGHAYCYPVPFVAHCQRCGSMAALART